jgi:DNA polymerase III gamma/tau subunit
LSFIVKYRPKAFAEVVGQDAAVKALQEALIGKRAQGFILEGPSGTGKTTLARLASEFAKCGRDVLEVDAATNSGIEAMRKVSEAMTFRAIGGNPSRACIVDEAHGLSRQAWDSLLKATEEPRPGVLWFLCTTNGSKIPKTVATRFARIVLKPVKEKDIERVVLKVVKAEGLPIGDGALDAVIALAEGSPRQALSNLVVCAELNTRKEATAAIQNSVETEAVIDLCRFLAKPGSYATLSDILERLDGESPEGVRIVVMNYFGKVMKGAKADGVFEDALNVLEAFRDPYTTNEGLGPLMVSIGRAYLDNRR